MTSSMLFEFINVIIPNKLKKEKNIFCQKLSNILEQLV